MVNKLLSPAAKKWSLVIMPVTNLSNTSQRCRISTAQTQVRLLRNISEFLVRVPKGFCNGLAIFQSCAPRRDAVALGNLVVDLLGLHIRMSMEFIDKFYNFGFRRGKKIRIHNACVFLVVMENVETLQRHALYQRGRCRPMTHPHSG